MNVLPQIRTSVVIVLVLTLLTGVIYPVLVTGLAQVMFPHQANGSLLYNSGQELIGSELIAQNFTAPQYFHPRPSAAGSDGYDPTSSGGSNLGPTNQKLIDSVKDRTEDYRKENNLAANAPVPVDAVTASGSGLDPEITPANAQLQALRVATARHLPEANVLALVDQYTYGRTLGFIGEPRVNVLKLNLALDNAR